MKAKELIKILEKCPEDDVYIHSSYDDCYEPLVKQGKSSKKGVIVIYCKHDSEHISHDYINFDK